MVAEVMCCRNVKEKMLSVLHNRKILLLFNRNIGPKLLEKWFSLRDKVCACMRRCAVTIRAHKCSFAGHIEFFFSDFRKALVEWSSRAIHEHE